MEVSVFWNDSSETLKKNKSVFSGHVYFEPVCTQMVLEAIIYLKNNNKVYSNI